LLLWLSSMLSSGTLSFQKGILYCSCSFSSSSSFSTLYALFLVLNIQ
jgi:hypothetical protein